MPAALMEGVVGQSCDPSVGVAQDLIVPGHMCGQCVHKTGPV